MKVQYTSFDFFSKLKEQGYSFKSKQKKIVREIDTNVETLQKNIEEFKGHIKKLKRYSPGATSRTRLEDPLDGFVQSYNKMKKNSENVTDKDVKKQLLKLEQLFEDHEKELKKVGIKKVNGKIEFDKDTFEDVDEKFIENIFCGNDSFIEKAYRITKKAGKTASDVQYNLIERKMNKTIKYDPDEINAVYLLSDINRTVSFLKNNSEKVKNENLTENEKEMIKKNMKLFGRSLSVTEVNDKNIEILIQACKDNQKRLEGLGFQFKTDTDEIYFDDSSISMSSVIFKDAYEYLFGKNSKFSNDILDHYQKKVDDIIKQEEIGISFIDEQI